MLTFMRSKLDIEAGLVVHVHGEGESADKKKKKKGYRCTNSKEKIVESLQTHRKRRRRSHHSLGGVQAKHAKQMENNTVIDGTFDVPEGNNEL